MDNFKRNTLRTLAEAVIDLSDGLGAEDWEAERANAIARALYDMADGLLVHPLPDHDKSYQAYQDEADQVAAQYDEEEDQRQMLEAMHPGWNIKAWRKQPGEWNKAEVG